MTAKTTTTRKTTTATKATAAKPAAPAKPRTPRKTAAAPAAPAQPVTPPAETQPADKSAAARDAALKAGYSFDPSPIPQTVSAVRNQIKKTAYNDSGWQKTVRLDLDKSTRAYLCTDRTHLLVRLPIDTTWWNLVIVTDDTITPTDKIMKSSTDLMIAADADLVRDVSAASA